MDRRKFITIASAIGGLAFACRDAKAAGIRMIEKRIPHSGNEALPAIGMGSYSTFDVSSVESELAPLREVLSRFHASGARVIDTSPMYGRAEAVLGELVAPPSGAARIFMATKVWIDGREAGARQIAESMRLLKRPVLDLVQIHNLRNWREHRRTLLALKEEGKVRYIGITHYTVSAHAALEQVIGAEDWDFVQLNHSIATRAAEDRLLPLCQDRGVAVLANRPFEEGEIFARVRGRELPAWVEDFDCTSWAQFFLKYVISHPAMTCAIPASSNPAHMADNLAAGVGRLPDAGMRAWMRRYFDSL